MSGRYGPASPHRRPVRLLAVPIAGRDTASSRLRLYQLVEGLPDRFTATVAAAGDGAGLRDRQPSDFDVVYVQKDARPAVVEFCRRAVDAGVPVVYDIDDDFGCWPDMDEATMCRLADAVTVDSPARAAALSAGTRAPVSVIPCMIDQADHPARAATRPVRERIGTVASFGNLTSLRPTVSYLTSVPGGIDTYVVGPAGSGDVLAPIPLVPFRLDRFVDDLLPADVFVLAHGAPEAPLKDNNRLVMALSLGTPALVSPTPAYLDLLTDIGYGWLACKPDEMPDRLAALADAGQRAAIGRVGREYAWEHYAPQRCVHRFVEVLDAVRDSR